MESAHPSALRGTQAGTQNKYDGTHYVSNPQGHGRRMEQRDSRGTGGIGRGAYHRQYFAQSIDHLRASQRVAFVYSWPANLGCFTCPKRTTRSIDSLRDATSDGRLGHSPDRMGQERNRRCHAAPGGRASRPLCHAQPHGPRRHRSLWRRHRLADTSLRSAGRPLWPDLQLDPSQRN